MSTSGYSLYRPIKVNDIMSLGFEIHDKHNPDSMCIKISKDKIKDHVDYYEMVMGDYAGNKNQEVYYLHLYFDDTKNGIRSFSRYGSNSPALNHFLEGLSKLGYKLKVEGERYNYEKEMNNKEKAKQYWSFKKVLSESN